MKINTISLENFKGVTADYHVGDVTVFTGPSFSGKTAALDAVKTALLGYHASLGKRHTNTFMLASGAAMSVNLTMSDGSRRDCRWTRAKGNVGYDGPADPLVPAMLFDLREFLSMTGAARLNYLFNQCDVRELGVSDDALMADLKNIKVVGHDEHAEEAIREVLDTVREAAADRDREGVSIQDFMGRLVGEFGVLAKDTAAMRRQHEGLVKASVRLESGDAPLVNPEASLASARERLTVARDTLSRAKELAAANDGWRLKHVRLTQRIALAAVIDLKPMEAALIEAELKLAAEPLVDTTGLRVEVARLETECGGAVKAVQQIKAEIAALVDKHGRDMAHESCPFCKSSRKGWRDAVDAEFKTGLETLTGRLEEAKLLHSVSDKKLCDAKALLDEARVKELNRAALANAVDVAKSKLESARRQNASAQALTDELAGLESAAPAPPPEMGPLVAAVNEAQSAVDAIERQRLLYAEAKQAERQRLEANAAHARLAMREAVFKAAATVVKSKMEQMVSKSVGAVINRARAFTDGIMPGVVEYHDGDFGYMRGGTWVSHEVFSGTETALAYAGLAVALAADSPLKLVVIDELGVMDNMTKLAVLKRMAKLVHDGVIDQFIGADVGTIAPLPSGVSEINVAA